MNIPHIFSKGPIHVSSSNLHAVWWVQVEDNLTEGDLLIDFRSGRSYVYHGVPLSLAEDLVACGSKGIFFNSFVKEEFLCEEV